MIAVWKTCKKMRPDSGSICMYLATVIEFYSNNFLPNFLEHNLLILLLHFKVRHFIRNGTKSSTSHSLSQRIGIGFLASPMYQDRSDNRTDLARQ